jgi:hypothetical protein
VEAGIPAGTVWLDRARSHGSCHASFPACCRRTIQPSHESPRRMPVGPKNTRTRAHARLFHTFTDTGTHTHRREPQTNKTETEQWCECSEMMRIVPVAFRTRFTNDVLPAAAKHVWLQTRQAR